MKKECNMRTSFNPFYDEDFKNSFKLKWKEKKEITHVYDHLDKPAAIKKEIIPYKETYLDQKTFVKEFKSDYQSLKYKLTYTALRLYEYIKDHVTMGDDYVKIDYEDIMRVFEWKSIRSVYNGINELMKYGFISDSDEVRKYWINVNIFFNGNRVAKFEEVYLEPKVIIKNGVKITMYEQRRTIVVES